jgi:toxin ParE1/3/4
VPELRVRFRPEAVDDVLETVDWYEERAAGLGVAFLHDLDRVLPRIAAFPHSAPEVHRGLRRALTRVFPHAIFYRFDLEEVVVLAVLHQMRDPDRLRSLEEP